MEYTIEQLITDDVSKIVNQEIINYPDSYLYINDLIDKDINSIEIDVLKKLFEKIPNIKCVLDFPRLLSNTDSEEILHFLYNINLENATISDLDLLEDEIRDLQEDNPDMLLIDFHKQCIEEGLWNDVLN
jgi:hypothetical protein